RHIDGISRTYSENNGKMYPLRLVDCEVRMRFKIFAQETQAKVSFNGGLASGAPLLNGRPNCQAAWAAVFYNWDTNTFRRFSPGTYDPYGGQSADLFSVYPGLGDYEHYSGWTMVDMELSVQDWNSSPG